MKPLIELKDVWKTYNMGEVKLDVLKGVSLTIEKGEFVVIIGPSGSGKSTLMNQVGILDVPTKGDVYLSGKSISKLEESQLATLRGKTIGFVFQQFNLIPTLTATENVTLPAIFQAMPEQKRIARAKSILSRVGLSDRLHHRPTELSGGQQQRVAIARALINNPSIILADEPTGNLDSESGQQVMDLLMHLHKKEKKTVIIVTHDVELLRYSEKTVHIKDGKIVKMTKNSH